ncbi:MAG TPA: hypothetical protein VI386_04630 [Candidatus Sulfotelmatobacter sp.]
MINENALTDALVSLAEISKNQYVFFSVLVNEVAALREAVRGLDPTFDDIFGKRQEQVAQATAASEKAVIAQYEEIIRKLRIGVVVS